MTKDNPENLKKTWIDRGGDPSWATAAMAFPEIGGDPEYLNLWGAYFSDFTGTILEIGAGTGFLAKHIIEHNSNIEYNILDIERNFEFIQNTLCDFSNVRYIKSSEYKKIFNHEWDLLIALHCLSETPTYYYTDILHNISTKASFIIDYADDHRDPIFNETLISWFEHLFPNQQLLNNMALLGAKKRGGIPVYIGRPL